MSWELTGNSGTNPATNFVGTTDNQPLIIRANNAEALRIHPPSDNFAARVGIGTTTWPGAALEIVSDGITDPLQLRTTHAGNPRSFRIGPNVGGPGIFSIYDD